MRKTLRYSLSAMAIAALLMGSISAFAQAPPSKGESSYSPVVIKESFEAIMARMKAAKPEMMKRQMDLLSDTVRPEQPAGPGGHHVPGKSDSGRRSGQTPHGSDVGAIGGDESRGDSGKKSFPRRVFAPSPPQPSGGGNALPQVPYRRDKETGGA